MDENKEILIGISGRKKSGKDTVGIQLSQDHNMYKYAFADMLKELCSVSFGVSAYDLYNLEYKEVIFSEFNQGEEKNFKFYEYKVNEEHAKVFLDNLEGLAKQIDITLTDEQKEEINELLLNKKISSYRELMQFIGTEVVRGVVSDTFWIDVLNEKIKNKDRVVITDARFPNERKYVKDRGGKLILVKRETELKDEHTSENSLGNDSEYHGVIDNNKDLIYLEQETERCYSCLTQDKVYRSKNTLMVLLSLLFARFMNFFKRKKK